MQVSPSFFQEAQHIVNLATTPKVFTFHWSLCLHCTVNSRVIYHLERSCLWVEQAILKWLVPVLRICYESWQEVGTRYLLTKNLEDYNIIHISISKQDQPFWFPFPINGEQYANDRLTDVSLSAPDSVCFFGESSQQSWQTLASGLTQWRENVFIMRPEAEPAGLVIKLKTIFKQREAAFVLWRNTLSTHPWLGWRKGV